jgi:hypothetical protein
VSRIPPSVRATVLERDKRCIASVLWPHVCRDAFGSPHPAADRRKLELDHVRPEAATGKEPPSEPQFLVALCSYAHQASGWATANRHALRVYLAFCAKYPVEDPVFTRLAALRTLRSIVVVPATPSAHPGYRKVRVVV